MSELLAPFDIPGTSARDVQAAAATVRATAARLGAPQSDVDVVLAALFSTMLSVTGGANAKTARENATDRTLLTPEQRLRVRTLLAAGWTQDAIAAEIGCARSTVAGVKAAGQ